MELVKSWRSSAMAQNQSLVLIGGCAWRGRYQYDDEKSKGVTVVILKNSGQESGTQ
jgi:hypothetical protein